jgi:hypothetical protein
MLGCFSLAQGFDVLHGEIISVDKDGPADLAGLKVHFLKKKKSFSGSSQRNRAASLNNIENFLLERAFNLCATLRLLFDYITNTPPPSLSPFNFCATLCLSG